MTKKKPTPEEIEVQIRDLAERGNFTMAETANIEDYESIARVFLKNILNIDYDKCFISDESQLSDFSSCGLPDSGGKFEGTLEDLYAVWRVYIVEKIYIQYGLTVPYNINLVELFEIIRQDQVKMRS